MILRNFFENLSIGSKMAFGSAITGLFFLLALWQYHATLTATLERHQHMLSGQNGRGVPVRHIQNHLLEARRHEKIFVLQKDSHAATLTLERVHLAQSDVRDLQQREADPGIRQRLAEILANLENYELAVRNLFHTWEVIGLNHGIGLQGHFREAIHQVEENLHQFDDNGLQKALERVHQEERNLLLFRGAEHLSALNSAVEGLRSVAEKISLESSVRQQLLEKLELYLSKATLMGGGGKGLREQDAAQMRESLGEIGALIQNHALPDLEIALLEMRRREKDFLLRGEEQYVEMVRSQLRSMVGMISGSFLASEEKQRTMEAMARYEGDFLALVEHTRHIKNLEKQLQESASRIESLTNTQLMEVDNATQAMVHEIGEKSAEGARLALVLVVLAMVNGAFFVIFISTRISRPVAEMIALAKIYSHSNKAKDSPMEQELPVEPAPQEPRNRDEIRQLFETMEQMNTNLREMVQLVDTQAEGLDCSSQELAEASTLLNQCAEEIQNRASLMESEQGGMLRRWSQEMRSIATKTRKRAQSLSAKARHLNQLLDRIQW